MKKTKLCAAGLAATMLLSTSALAATDLQKQDADLLNELGLLKGTGSGYALDRTMTRVEGGVMLVRLLGGEKEALAKSYACPFTDVADWAKPYVGWLYHEKLTNGTSATTYVPNRQMTMKEYLWFLGRASGYTDEEIADGKGVVSKASYDAQKDTKINRGQMSALSIDTLYHEVSGSKETLADQLIAQDTFSKMQWDLTKYHFEQIKKLPHSEDVSQFRVDKSQKCIMQKQADGTEIRYFYYGAKCISLTDGAYGPDPIKVDENPDVEFISYDGTSLLFALKSSSSAYKEVWKSGVAVDEPLKASEWFEKIYIYQKGENEINGKLSCVDYWDQTSYLSSRKEAIHSIIYRENLGVSDIYTEDRIQFLNGRLYQFEDVDYNEEEHKLAQSFEAGFLPKGKRVYMVQSDGSRKLIFDFGNLPFVRAYYLESISDDEVIFDAYVCGFTPKDSPQRWLMQWKDHKVTLLDLPEYSWHKDEFLKQYQTWLDENVNS